jgi:C4-dicarboxylate-specific signal transduction histidine kinase
MTRDILYVDDELDNLLVFEATFGDDFQVYTAHSGEEALALLEQRPFPVVVSDQRMPGLTGAELFEIMRRRHPHTRRVMLTGYADPRAMLDAINQGQVYHFVKKPWERDQLFSVLVRAIEAHDLELANLAMADRLVVLDRCAALGRSAARIAHEMGNRMNVLPLVELIEEQYRDQEDLRRMAALARETHQRLAELIGEVKSFVRFQHEDVPLVPLPLAETVHELLAFLRYDQSLPRDRLDVHVRAEPVVRGHKIKLQQVLINLLKNAADAVRDRDDGRIALSIDQDGECAVIAVEDNGCGMAPEVQARVFEPFFTTKGIAGNGLGLDVVKCLVEAHGGTIDCRSTPEAGAVFTIRLPVASNASNPAAPAEAVFSNSAAWLEAVS